jgi:UDPglucose--hexose-1-phosphate uridylyltransferase
MSELREDLLTGARVIVAPGRSVRPDTFRTDGPQLPSSVPACPFCEGNEHETPPEVARRGSGDPQTAGWRVRVVPNKYPLVGEGVGGAHEVVVLSPPHDRSFADLDDAAAVEVFEVLRDRIGAHLADGHTHAHAFINHGKPAGASIEHPHAQVIALDFVPPFVDAMLDRFAAAHRDLVHDVLDEARVENLMIADGDAACWCPPASEMPYAARCASPLGRRRFDIAADGELRAVALTLRDYLARLRTVLGDVPYNVTINTAPAADDRPYHWWLDILPRLTVPAGFEHATGLAVCTIAPEAAAAAIREAI